MPTKISQFVELTVNFQIIHTVDAHRWLTIKMIHVANTDVNPVTVQLCYVPPAGAPLQSNAALWNYSIPANDFIEFGEGDVLFPNWSIRALASAGNSINVKLGGIEDV